MKDKLMVRPFLNGHVRQRIDNEMLCLTDLSRMYDSVRVENGWSEKKLAKFFNNDSNQEYVIEILELQGVFIKCKKLHFIEQVKNQGLIKALTSIGQYKGTGRGDNKAVYCNPYIFVAVAQWLNPRFRAAVTIWVADQLILNRIEAGSKYNLMCKSINDKIIPTLSEKGKRFIYSSFAKELNIKIFGRHEGNLRQIASKEQLMALSTLEAQVSALIDVGYIKNVQDLKSYLNK